MIEPLASTIDLRQAEQQTWDALIVGAGIAGSLAAKGLADQGLRVLVLERGTLPRDKVCGACLNEDAIAGLKTAGVWDSIASVGGHDLDRYDVRSKTRRASLRLPGGHAVSRYAMDHVLARRAIESGAQYCFGTSCRVLPLESEVTAAITTRGVETSTGLTLSARVVIAASGLATRSSSEKTESELEIHPDSRIGLGARWKPPADTETDVHPGVIYMTVAETGYVGIVLTEDGTINLAAAVDAGAVKQAGTAALCDEILRSCGLNVGDGIRQANFRGTPTLTRRRPLAGGHRLLYAGDASGYVEPFTGEGMAWAVRAGGAVVPWAVRGVESWSDDLPAGWTKNLRQSLGVQQRRCRVLARLLRYPTLVRSAIGVISKFPSLGQFAVEQIQRERSTAVKHHSLGDGRPQADRGAA